MSQPSSQPGAGDAVTAALLQITAHAERLAALDEREAAHYGEIVARLAELAQFIAQADEQTGDLRATAERQAAILGSLDGLDREVAAIADRITHLTHTGEGEQEADAYWPAPTPRWWKLHGPARDEALARLRAWVEQIYRPGYGHLAAGLGPCWDQHPLCLYGLDWLMELWSTLYLAGQRKPGLLASQAEWQTRLLPALAEQMYLETTRCQHNHGTRAKQGRPDIGRHAGAESSESRPPPPEALG